MTAEQFDEILGKRLAKTREVLASKAEEYSTGRDRMHNFNRAGAVLNCTPERALLGMWTKHIVSVLDIIDGVDSGKLPSIKLLDEKIGDLINYAILLEALMKGRT